MKNKKKTEPKKLEWRKQFYKQFCYTEDGVNELDWDLFPPIQHIGKDRLGELTDFIQSLIQSTREETIRKVISKINDFTSQNMTLVFKDTEIPIKPDKAYIQGCQTGFVQGIKNIQKLVNSLLKE